ncbi:MAG: metal-sensitive transcriptional regulator [Thermoplasmatota archaeon]
MGETKPAGVLDAKRSEVRARLSRAHGHLHGVIDMIDKNRSYAEVLQQMLAVRGALEKATAVIVEDMLERIDAKSNKRELAALRAALRTLA